MKHFLILLFFSSVAFSQNSDIVGVSRTNDPNNAVYLARVNDNNGLVQDIATTSYSEYISNVTYTVDPDNNIFYYTSNSNLLGIDITNGQLVLDVAISTSLQPFFQNFVYNEITQELIGLERGTSGGNEVYLSKINPQTGIVTPISQSTITDVITLNGGSTIDLNNQWFQFVSNGKLFSVDVNTGQVIHSPTIDTSQVAFFDNILFNAFDGQLYGLGRNSSPPEILLGRINPVTGNVSLISQESLSDGFSLSGAAINPFSGVYYFKGLNEFIGVNINTGNLFSSTPLDFSQSNGDYFDYYYFSGRVVPLLSNQDFNFTNSIKIYPNPVESVVSIDAKGLKQISIFNINGQQLSKIDVQGRDQEKIDLSSFPSGTYFLSILSNGQNSVKKIVKR